MKEKQNVFDRFFGVTKSGSNMKTEIMAGITTFVTIAYVLVVNPQVIGGAVGSDQVANGVFIAGVICFLSRTQSY